MLRKQWGSLFMVGSYTRAVGRFRMFSTAISINVSKALESGTFLDQRNGLKKLITYLIIFD